VGRKHGSGHFVSGLAGGLVVAVAAIALLATGVIETGGDEASTIVQKPITQPVADEGESGLTVNEIYERVSPGVVFIEAQGVKSTSPFGLPQRGGVASGSGFVLDREGSILTNAHVVDGAKQVTVAFGDEQVPAEVVGADLSSDLAVIEVDPDDVEGELRPLALADSEEVKVGDPTVAIGSPFGFESTVTTGIVSALQRQIQAPNGFQIDAVIQTDASINPGNSGGPLLDAQGRVIGINSQIATGGASGSVGVGFAVPTSTAKEVVPQLQEDGEVERAFLGVTTTDVTETLAKELELPVDQGALVQDVVPDGPSDDAGIRAGAKPTAQGLREGGDIIVTVDGDPITESADVATAIADNQPGDTIEVELYRGDEQETVEVELGERPEQATGLGGGPGGGGGGGGLPFPLP
jgi:S1-C subfamily serine protease